MYKKMEKTKRPPRRSSIISLSKSLTPRNQAKIFSTFFSLSAFVKRVNKLTQSQRDAVIRTGFGNLLLIGNRMIAKTLLNALMERWHPKKHAFVLGKEGIITITPLDVALILGLRVTGEPVKIVREKDLPFIELEGKYGATLWNRKITVASIDERLNNLGEKDDEEFVRLFVLFTFGTFLFPNTNHKVDSRYLYFLQDLDSVGQFAWGVAVLDELTHWLTKRKEENVQYVGGCLLLLQIWLYEHIDVARPSLRNQDIKFPRACRWDNSKCLQRATSSLQFKNLQTNQISWFLDLTLEELELEIIKELLPSQREMVTTHIDLDSRAGGALASVSPYQQEDYSNPLRSSLDSPEKASTSCSQDKQDPNVIFTNTAMSNIEQDAAVTNEKQNPDFNSIGDVSHNIGDDVLENVSSCQQVPQKGRSFQSKSPYNMDAVVANQMNQHCSSPTTSCPQEKQDLNSIAMSNEVCNNQGNGLLSNEEQIPNFISVNNDGCNNQGHGALVNNDYSNKLSSLQDQCSFPSASCCPQVMGRLNFIHISSDNGYSNQLRSICDLASTSMADQCSSSSASSCPQVRQRLNFVDISSDDNEDESTSEDSGLKQEISKLRKENSELLKEVESLKHQNVLHLSAYYNTVTSLNSILFSEIAD